MNKISLYLMILSVTSLLWFFINNRYLRGYLRSEASLANELRTPQDSLRQYKIATIPPFKYRILFPAIVKSSYHAVFKEPDTTTFYYTYVFWSAVFYTSAVCAFFLLLITCGYNAFESLLGTLLFLSLPPMLLAYTIPVHTREDTLAYTLFFTALIFLLRNKKTLFLLTSLIGVLCRETLLLLPLLYFFFYDDKNLISRFTFAALPGLVWIALRLWMGHHSYNIWEGLQWNLKNPEQVIGFLFITFNVSWISFFYFTTRYADHLQTPDLTIRFFYRSSFFTLIIILVTTFLGGIFNEIRLLYLFAPWMVIIFMEYIKKHQHYIRQYLQSQNFKWYALGSVLFSASLLYIVLLNQEKLIVPGKYAVPYPIWITFSVIYICIGLLFLPFILRKKVEIRN